MKNLEQFSQDEIEAALQVCRTNLIDYQIATHPAYNVNWHHELVADALEKVVKREIKRLMIFEPPRYGKTQQATIDFPSWALGNNPREQIITVSYSDALARTFGSKTRDKVESELYKRIFDTRIRQDTRSKDYWETTEGGFYNATGFGGAITGKGATILIIDDPIKNLEEAKSEVYREKIWDYYTSTLYTRLEKDAVIVLMMTRWHFDDLAGRLIEQMEEGGDFADDWKIIRLPAEAEQDEVHYIKIP